jgi:hypothetical protein
VAQGFDPLNVPDAETFGQPEPAEDAFVCAEPADEIDGQGKKIEWVIGG